MQTQTKTKSQPINISENIFAAINALSQLAQQIHPQQSKSTFMFTDWWLRRTYQV